MAAKPRTDPEYVTVGVEASELDRYDDIRLENGEVLIYDRDEEDAWFQSDSALDLVMMS